MLTVIFRSLLLLTALAFSSAWASPPFPDLLTIDGDPVTDEADVGTGKWQIVMIWSTDCSVCRAMKPLLSEFHDQHKDTDAKVYGVALDGRANIERVQQYMVDHNVSFPTFVGELDLIAINYEINSSTPFMGTPTYLMFNPVGELVAIDFGELDMQAVERFISRNS